ncbi:aldehyde dehydrogenase (NADP(+)) [Pedobacter sp. LMG 31643]|nr:aldehyde dehydrogenase (NADP(+)) [Pedobacter foliorum]
MDGRNIVAATFVDANEGILIATNPATGLPLAGDFFKSSSTEVASALRSATAAFRDYRKMNKDVKASFLNAIASEIEQISGPLVERASAESGLPLARLQGELGRTTGQLRLFANLVSEGSWVNAVIDTELPDRKPLARPDLRSMLVPIGPVVVFGASNFPLAFSVAGGDTASALAAGCPVIVKAHPGHYGTSALVGAAIVNAIKKTGMPKGIFSLLYDDGYSIGQCLVQHELTKAITFTGSYSGGMALIRLAQQRTEPIPVFAEMGSINPVVFLPEALEKSAGDLAKKYAASISLGAGQFCTNPGLLLGIQSPALEQFKRVLAASIADIPSATMLTKGIAENYKKLTTEVTQLEGVRLLSVSKNKDKSLQNQSEATVAEVNAIDFIQNPSLQEEVFGPYSMLVIARDISELMEVVAVLKGQLTVTIMASKPEVQQHQTLVDALSEKTGRIIFNGVPTGVEVCGAMQHGGPFPATNDSRFTSVGSAAINRFVRPLAYQDWEQELLPDELKDENPLEIFRTVNQKITKS